MTDSAQSTIVGESILITGNLHGDEDLTILGRVEGSISLSKTLIVAESGVVKAEITVRNAVVSGIVVGNITATDSVQVTESGRLVGDLRAPRIIITAGARVRGQVDMGDLEAPRLSAPLPARTNMGMTRSSSPATTRPSAASLPPRRTATPPPPPPARAAAPVPAPVPARAAAPAAPVAAKKIKKKVVVKKKG